MLSRHDQNDEDERYPQYQRILNRRSPISKDVGGGGLAINVSASWPSIVCRPVRQTSCTAAARDYGGPGQRNASDFPLISAAGSLPPWSAACFSTG